LGSLLVVIKGGQYRVKQTFVLTAEDSGTEQAPVVFRAALGETPRFTDGVRLRGFKPISDRETLKRLPPKAAGKVRELDLRTVGITDGFGGVQIHGGKDNIVDNNLLIHCAAALSFSPWEDERWRNYVAPVMTNSEINAALYLQRYPALASLAENVNTNAVYRSALVRCGELFRHPPTTIDAVDNIILADADTSLRLDNPLLNPRGFARIPVDEMGLYQDAFRKEKPHTAFSRGK
jgi:hypothetical protein